MKYILHKFTKVIQGGIISSDAQENLEAAIEALEDAVDYLEEIE